MRRGPTRLRPTLAIAVGAMLFGVLVAGCGGGSRAVLPPALGSSSASGVARSGSLSIQVRLPLTGTIGASSLKRSPQYVSGATQGVYITGTCVAGGGTITQNCTGAAFPAVYADVSASSPLCTGSPRICTLSANPVAGYSYAVTVAAVDAKPTGEANGYGTGFASTVNMLAVGSQPPPLPAATGSPAPSPSPTNLGQPINRGGVNSININLNAIATQFVQVNPVSGAAVDNAIPLTATGTSQEFQPFFSAGDAAGNLIAAPSCMNTYDGEVGSGAGATITQSSAPGVMTAASGCDGFAGPDGKQYAITLTPSSPAHVCAVNPGVLPPACGTPGSLTSAYDNGDFAPISQFAGVWTQAPPGVLDTYLVLQWDGIADNDTCSGTTPKCGVPIPIGLSNAIPASATPVVGRTTSYNVTNANQFTLAPFVTNVSCGTNPSCAAATTQSGCTGYCPTIALNPGGTATVTVYLYASGETSNLAAGTGCYTTSCFSVAVNGSPPNASSCYTGLNEFTGVSVGSPACNDVLDTGNVAGVEPAGTADCLAPANASNAGAPIALVKPGTFTKGAIGPPGAADSMTFTVQALSSGTTGSCSFEVVDPNRGIGVYSLPVSVQVSSSGTVITVPPSNPLPIPGQTTNAQGCTILSAPFSQTCSFNPNAVTISTSEGAPYADGDVWIDSGPLTTASMFGYGPTKVVRLYICLTGFVSLGSCSTLSPPTGPLSSGMLTQMSAAIASYAGTGVRVMPRFIYNFGPIGAPDASLNVILGHVDQIAPILLANKDLIFGLEAGFFGTWGEWHDSTNGNITVSAEKSLLDKELGYFGGVFPIFVRYPGDLIAYEKGSTTPVTSLGLHDDYYASASDDGGTFDAYANDPQNPNDYAVTELESYQAAVSTSSVFGGEFGADYATDDSCSALDAYAYVYHPQMLSLSPYPTDIGTTLQTNGCALTFYNKIGTRIVLQSAKLTGNPAPSGAMSASLTLVNAGYGRVVRQRPVTLAILSGSTVVASYAVSTAAMDLRTLTSAASPVPQTFTIPFTLPATLPSGPLSAALYIADPATSLTSQASYALPLNSVDGSGTAIFNPSTGYNTFATFTHG